MTETNEHILYTMYTIGHSNHKIKDFIALLNRHGVTLVADIRSTPYSRYCPQFNKDLLAADLKAANIGYMFLGDKLGARPHDLSLYEGGHANYGRIESSQGFKSGLQRLLADGKKYRIALMCSEKDPLGCHRAILVSRHLKRHNVCIKHILADGSIEDHVNAERRLVTMLKIEPTLFESPKAEEHLIEQAYEQQAHKITFGQNRGEGRMSEQNSRIETKVRVFTIGFSQKSAREFFTKLKNSDVKRVIDVRLNNVSQLAGFTKRRDLEYFLEEIGGLAYVHRPDLAPTKEILNAYKKKEIDWGEYERQFLELMMERHIEDLVTLEEVGNACFLCSEAKPEKCHRRLVVEYLRDHWGNLEIRHL